MSGVDGDKEEKDGEVQDDKDEEAEDSEEDQDEDVICQPCESAPIVIAKTPYNPTHEEKENNYCTHLPYRNWCPVCVQAKGKEDDHKRSKAKDHEGKPTMVLDYKSFDQDIIDEKVTCIVMRDKKTGMTASHICESKGITDSWPVQRIVEDIEGWGYTDIIMKTDGEPALIQFVEEVKNEENIKRFHNILLLTILRRTVWQSTQSKM